MKKFWLLYKVWLSNNETEQSRSVQSWEEAKVNALENTWVKQAQQNKPKLKVMVIVFFDFKGEILENRVPEGVTLTQPF